MNGPPKQWKASQEPFHLTPFPSMERVQRFDQDEEAVLRLPPDFPTLAPITMNNCKYETILSRTKVRSSRKTEASPQELEAEASEPEQLPTPKDLIEQEQVRELYNPDTKTLNFNKLKATDTVNNPRIHLPKPRPQMRKLSQKQRKLCTMKRG